MIEVPQNSTMIISTTETSATTSKKRGEGRRYYCTNIFRSASKLFIDEWSKDADDDIQVFIQYFKSEYIDNNSSWFESYNQPNDAGSTSNNKCNESINGVIKAEDILRN
jgi:hypothetical protein